MALLPRSKVLIIYTGGTIGMKNAAGRGYHPVPNYLADTLASMSRFNDDEYKQAHPQLHEEGGREWYTMPLSIYNKRVSYTILEYDPLLDSANMQAADWSQMATDIKAHYTDFDAMIILHGTDTIACGLFISFPSLMKHC